MKDQIDEGSGFNEESGWWRIRLMKDQVDEGSGWWRIRLMKEQVDEGAGW